MTDEQRVEIEGVVAKTRAIMHPLMYPLVASADNAYFQDTLGNLWVYTGVRDHGMIAGVRLTADREPTDERLFEPKEVAFLNT